MEEREKLFLPEQPGSRELFSNFRAATLCLAIVFSRGVDASEFSGLMGRIPRGANAIMVIDVDATLASPIAVSNGWQGRFSDGSASRPMYLPPEADKVVVAAQLDQVRGFNRIWEVALMGLKAPMPMSLVARAEGGYTDTINGVNVAWVPSDA